MKSQTIDWARVAQALAPHLEPNGALHGCVVETESDRCTITDPVLKRRLASAWVDVWGGLKIDGHHQCVRRTLRTRSATRIAVSLLDMALASRPRFAAERAERLRAFRVEREVVQALAESHREHVGEVGVDADRNDGLVCITLSHGASLVCLPERAGAALDALLAFRTAAREVREPKPVPET